MDIKITNINLSVINLCETDILLNKELTNISPSNMYEILFDSQNFDNIFNIFLKRLKEEVNENFNVYIKNMWGYIQKDKNDDAINFNMNFKNQIAISSKYSFICPIKANETIISLKKENNIQNIILNKGDMLLFKTSDFVKEESDSKERIVLVGSISNIIQNIKPIIKEII